MKHLVSIGGGLSSTIELPMEVIRKYGADNVDLVIACLKGEHPDLWRLVTEIERLTGKQVTKIAYCPERASKYVIHAPESYWLSIWDVFRETGRMGSSLADPCSRMLKRETLRRYILRTYSDGGAVIHVGIKPDEIERQMAILANWKKAGYRVEFDLCDNPDYRRASTWVDWIPTLYEHGFPHNNCSGFCVKAGHAQMARLLYYYPDIFHYHAEQEKRFQADFHTDATIMRDRVTRGGITDTTPLSLYAFAERMKARWSGLLPGFDPFDGLDETPGCRWCDAVA